ncbi:hypothetical protein VNI00_004404 [Paramarasmius palmivorus]|uniref:F-box domain-containing protein n=1 Tax=Paramarasmius palmivorus TaxID=297713 RepID=A0AAW0DN52_9AGAR
MPVNVASLPPDILGPIFQLLVSSSLQGKIDVMGPTERPVVLELLRVCRHWHAVADSDASLWTTLHLFCPAAGMLPTIRRWLDRAKHLPLSLALADHRRGSSDHPANTVLQEFVSRFSQWKSIIVVTANFAPAALHLPLGLGGTNDVLEYAEFRHDLCTPFELSYRLWGILLTSTGLRGMTWIGKCDLGSETAEEMPYFAALMDHTGLARLEYLQTRVTLNNNAVSLLSSLPNLGRLVLTDITMPAISHGVLFPLSIPTLHTLEFRSHPSHLMRLNPIMPALSRIVLNFRYLTLESIAVLLEEKCTHLKHFECAVLDDNGARGGLFAMLARTMPSLITVKLTFKHRLRRPWLMGHVRFPDLEHVRIRCEKDGCNEFDSLLPLFRV